MLSIRKFKILMLNFPLMFFLFLSCAPKDVPSSLPEGVSPAPLKEEKVAREAWQVEWEKTLQAAKKEGKVVVYADVFGQAVKEANPLFKKKYGIDLEVVSGRGAELRAKIRKERAAGLYLADIAIISQSHIYDYMKPEGVTAPIESILILPEVLDKAAWLEGKLPWTDPERSSILLNRYPLYAIGYNTQLVKPGEINSHYDILDPRWKGKLILNDPTLGSGAAFSNFSTFLYRKILDQDFFKQLVKQEPVMLRDRLLQVNWLARGRYAAIWGVHSESLIKYRAEGAPVAFAPLKEGILLASGSGHMAFVDKAPHPNASKIFINWFLTREGQAYVHKVIKRQSTRIDISTEGVEPSMLRDPKQKYIENITEDEKWILEEQPKYIELARQLFAPLLK